MVNKVTVLRFEGLRLRPLIHVPNTKGYEHAFEIFLV